MEVLKMKKFIFVLAVLIAGFQAPVYALDNEAWLHVEDEIYRSANTAYVDAKSGDSWYADGIFDLESGDTISYAYYNVDDGGLVSYRTRISGGTSLLAERFINTMFDRHGVLADFLYMDDHIIFNWRGSRSWYTSVEMRIDMGTRKKIDITFYYTAESLKNPRRR
jgi:hypothetical protein